MKKEKIDIDKYNELLDGIEESSKNSVLDENKRRKKLIDQILAEQDRGKDLELRISELEQEKKDKGI